MVKRLSREEGIAKFNEIPPEKRIVYAYRHRVSEDKIPPETFAKYGIQLFKMAFHDPFKHGESNACSKETHYHYVIKMTDEQIIDSLCRKVWEHDNLKALYSKDGVKNYGVFNSVEHFNNTMAYLGEYEEIILNPLSEKRTAITQEPPKVDVASVLVKSRDEAKQLAVKNRRALQDTAREMNIDLDEDGKREVVQELKYINVVKGYFPKFLDTTEDEYLRKVNACQLLKQREAIDRAWNYIRKAKQNDITRKMAEPLTLEELKELIALPSFEHTDKYMRKILNTVYNKRVRDNKCVLMWLCGSASAGKSVMMEILGYIFGPSHGLDKSQIWKDILAMDAPAKKNARCLTFEEFNISEVDSEKKKVALTKLKEFTSGRMKSVRVALNDKNQEKNNLINIEYVFITTNDNVASLLPVLMSDQGVAERMCIQQFDQPIPTSGRIRMGKNMDRAIALYVRYFYDLWMKAILDEEPIAMKGICYKPEIHKLVKQGLPDKTLNGFDQVPCSPDQLKELFKTGCFSVKKEKPVEEINDLEELEFSEEEDDVSDSEANSVAEAVEADLWSDSETF